MLSQNDKEKAEDAFKTGSAEFTNDKLNDVLKDEETAKEKARRLGGFFEEFTLLWQLLCDYKNGTYCDVPWKFIAAVGFSVLYLINPFDVLPDILPGVGYLDDASVFGLVLAGFKSDIERYKMWKTEYSKK